LRNLATTTKNLSTFIFLCAAVSHMFIVKETINKGNKIAQAQRIPKCWHK